MDLSCPELSVKARALSRFERGIVHQVVDDVKTPESNRSMHIDAAMLEGLKDWKQLSQFSGPV